MSRVDELRRAIDKCDDELVSIIARRQALVAELSKEKVERQIPVQVSQREQEIHRRLKNLAQQSAVSPELILDVMQRIMRDSYRLQSQSKFGRATDNPKKVVVIGGQGQLGGLFCQLFQRSGHQVVVLDKQDEVALAEHYVDADLVLLSLPQQAFRSVVKQLPTLDSNTILADLSSTKAEPLAAMLAAHSGPVIGLHPMFGPTLEHVTQQLVIICEGRQPAECQWLVEQLELWGCQIQPLTSNEHEQLMSYIQSVRHLSAIVLGDLLLTNRVDIEQLASVSTAAFKLELSLLARLFSHQAELYIDILLASGSHCETLAQLGERHRHWIQLLAAGDRTAMLQRFQEIAAYLNDFSPDLQNASQPILNAFQDRTKFSE